MSEELSVKREEFSIIYHLFWFFSHLIVTLQPKTTVYEKDDYSYPLSPGPEG